MTPLLAAACFLAPSISRLPGFEEVREEFDKKGLDEFAALKQALDTLPQTPESWTGNLKLYTHNICALVASMAQPPDDVRLFIYSSSLVSAGLLRTVVDVMPESVNSINFHNPIALQLH